VENTGGKFGTEHKRVARPEDDTIIVAETTDKRRYAFAQIKPGG
jgi:hypothetical protein